jgi:hypothetical protein
MNLEKIITHCGASHKLRLLLMSRSLRALGCDLPLLVIPFGSDTFDLPKNASWWIDQEIAAWIKAENINPRKQKFQCLTTGNYQFVDTDIFFLRNPEKVLAAHSGFVANCQEWKSTQDATSRVATKDSVPILKRYSTLWQRNVFCAGQFACEHPLYNVSELIKTACKPEHAAVCMHSSLGDQEAMNLLVSVSEVGFTNLTLPPYLMESSWIGDYPDDPAPYWKSPERKPYLIHYWSYAHRLHENREINSVFKELLTTQEQQEWAEEAKRWQEERVIFDQIRERTIEKMRPSKARRLVGRLGRATRVLMRGY